jgi:hypothetical protein
LLTSVLTGLLATSLAVVPTPLTWQSSPVPDGNAVLYTTEQAQGEQWAVGIALEPEDGGPAVAFHPLALRHDATGWHSTKSAVPDGRLDDLLVRGRNDVWAVGATDDVDSVGIVQHWTGKAWKQVATPAAIGSGFTAIAPAGKQLLLGQYNSAESSTAVLRSTANGWKELPRDGLQNVVYIDDLVALPGGQILAAGIGGMAKYDGTAWKPIKLPLPTDRTSEIAHLLVRSATDIWAVGEKPSEEYWRQPLALHYDGKTWTEVPAPVRTGQFHDVDLVDGKLVAVGGDPNTGEPLVAEYDGQKFVPTTTPPGAGYLHGSSSTGKQLTTVGVALQSGLELPFIAVGKHKAVN